MVRDHWQSFCRYWRQSDQLPGKHCAALPALPPGNVLEYMPPHTHALTEFSPRYLSFQWYSCQSRTAVYRSSISVVQLFQPLLYTPSHQTSSHYVRLNGLKLCANFMDVVQTSWTGYKLYGRARASRTLNLLKCFWWTYWKLFWCLFQQEIYGYNIFSTLLLTQVIFNLPYHTDMVWEQLIFDDTVS